jgi:hypothetical protein
VAFVGVRLEGLVVFKIERRPRGASRINPLLHLLQRAMACQAMVVRLWRTAKYRDTPPAPTQKSRHAHKAGNHGLSDIGTLQQM